MDQQTQKRSLRPVWVVVAVLVVFFIVLASAIYLVVRSDGGKQPGAVTTTATGSKEVTKDEIARNLNDLNGSIKQATKDQAAAKAAIDASKNQTKIGS